ncbi:MAG: cytoplasmic protein [Thermodesulfobacteriota bacterium]|nr:cytoplasmic protein [Thermodesulfobacteriota bacterium]
MNDQNIDFAVDRDNLYKEESITDLKVAAIRKLVPIKPDGQEDPDREAIFVGNTQLMSPEGPIPLQAKLEAKNLEEAMNVFPDEMQKAMAEMQERIRQYQAQQKQEESRIITPGR